MSISGDSSVRQLDAGPYGVGVRGDRPGEQVPSASKLPTILFDELVLVSADREDGPSGALRSDGDPVARPRCRSAVDGDDRVQRQVTGVSQGSCVGIAADHTGDRRPALEGLAKDLEHAVLAEQPGHTVGRLAVHEMGVPRQELAY